MRTTTTVVIGAGHAGLAMSRCLTERSIDHVVLERGEVAELVADRALGLAPAAHAELAEPAARPRLRRRRSRRLHDDAARSSSFIDALRRADRRAGPDATPRSRRCDADDDGYVVDDRPGRRGAAATVVLATGACNVPDVPARRRGGAADGHHRSRPTEYRNPDQLADGGVLVVGAVGHRHPARRRDPPLGPAGHARRRRARPGAPHLPGPDIHVVDGRRRRARRALRRGRRHRPGAQRCRRCSSSARRRGRRSTSTPSPAIGVRLVGRLAGIRDGKAQFSGSLRNVCALADLKLGRLLDTIDEWADGERPRRRGRRHRTGFDADRTSRRRRRSASTSPSGEIRTIVWATGFRPDYSWLDVPVLDRKGRIRHDGGVVDAAPGLYVIGLPFLRRRKSTLIDGAGDDARDLGAHLAAYLDDRSPPPGYHPRPLIPGPAGPHHHRRGEPWGRLHRPPALSAEPQRTTGEGKPGWRLNARRPCPPTQRTTGEGKPAWRLNARRRQQARCTTCRAHERAKRAVGTTGLEPGTSSVSYSRSNHRLEPRGLVSRKATIDSSNG